MKSSEHRTDRPAMDRLGLLQRISWEESDDGGGFARECLKNAPLAVVNGRGAPDAVVSEVLHEAEKEGKVFRRDALLVEGQNELAVGCAEKKIAVLDAFRDSLEGRERPNGVTFEERV